jgi:hypothetical protein
MARLMSSNTEAAAFRIVAGLAIAFLVDLAE